MEYKCRCCGAIEWASNVDEMLERKGYCIICDTLGEEARNEVIARIEREQKQLAKKEYAEKHYNKPIDISRDKKKLKHHNKIKNKIKVFKCGNKECGYIEPYSSFDHKCPECNSKMYFLGRFTKEEIREMKRTRNENENTFI